jgi:hypothetical protein
MEKKIYLTPQIETIVLDCEISLAMESEEPPAFESVNQLNQNDNNNPYKTT